MANNPSDNNKSPPERQDKSNVDDPNRDRHNDAGHPQQQGEQGKQGQQGQPTDKPQQKRPDDMRDERKPQQR